MWPLLLDTLQRDARLAIRRLIASPGWTAAAVFCLAVATGANTAAFTVMNGLLLRPLPFDAAEQLVMAAVRDPAQSGPRPFSLDEYRALAGASGPAAELLARSFFPLSLATSDGAAMAEAEVVSGNYFSVLRLRPHLGRLLTDTDDRAGGPEVAVVSHRLWTERFDATPAAVGLPVRVNGRLVTIVGVAPPGFVGATQLVAADLWMPAAIYPQLAGNREVAAQPAFGVIGRLAPATGIAAAQAQLSSALASATPRRSGPPLALVLTPAAGFGVPPAVQGLVASVSLFLYLMMALLVAVAGANVAALMLARGVTRAHDVAVRLSLGAAPSRIAWQLLVESFALATIGCVVGAALAFWLTDVLVTQLSSPFQYVRFAVDLRPDARVFAWCGLGLALATALCGVVPIRSAGRVDVVDLLKRGGSHGAARVSTRSLNVLVTIQFATSAALLVLASTLVRSYTAASDLRPSFATSRLMLATLDFTQIGADASTVQRLSSTLAERLDRTSGVAGVGLSGELPLAAGTSVPVVMDRGDDAGPTRRAVPLVVSDGYFGALGLPLRQGRGFRRDDGPGPAVTIVSETMARTMWPDASPLGQTFRLGEDSDLALTVVGVVADAVEPSPSAATPPVFYRPLSQTPSSRLVVTCRLQTDPGAFAGEMRRTVQALHPDLAIVDLRTMDDARSSRAEQRRLPAAMLTMMALLSLALSTVGLYGLVSYGVRGRSRELGIRLALGAQPGALKALVLRHGLAPVLIGLSSGALGGVGLAQVIRTTFFGLSSPRTIDVAAISAVLLVAGIAALYRPARWAARLQPSRTLRAD